MHELHNGAQERCEEDGRVSRKPRVFENAISAMKESRKQRDYRDILMQRRSPMSAIFLRIFDYRLCYVATRLAIPYLRLALEKNEEEGELKGEGIKGRERKSEEESKKERKGGKRRKQSGELFGRTRVDGEAAVIGSPLSSAPTTRLGSCTQIIEQRG